MEIWLILNGEKSGPLHDFDVRKKIEAGEVDAQTPAWHEGLGPWRPLGKIQLFEGEFEALLEKRYAPEEKGFEFDDGPLRTPPPLPGNTWLIRRFWARWLDLYFYAGIWWILMWTAGRDIGGMLEDPWILLFQYIPWFVLESFLLHRFATTPGKRLLGIRVFNDDGSHLSLGQASLRSSRVLFMGIGFGWGFIALICQAMALVATRRLGRPIWDHVGHHTVSQNPLHPVGVSAYVVSLFIALQLQFIVVAPYAIENTIKIFPQLKEQLEKNPPWHLPKR